MRRIGVLFFVTLFLFATPMLSIFYLRVQRFGDGLLAISHSKLFTIKAGSGIKAVARKLEREGILSSGSRLLPWLWRSQPSLGSFKVGTYLIEPGVTPRTLLRLFSSGKEAQFPLCFPEGASLKQWLNLLDSAPYLEHSLRGKTEAEVAYLLTIPHSSLEGWLFPETYHYTAGSSDLDLLQRAYQQMQKKLGTIWSERSAELPLESPYELLILASIVEKESGVHSEKGKIASVFINRLKRGMRLQADPTVIYALREKYSGSLTRRDLSFQSKYNTYLVNGLPPTPIAMPGERSLHAVARPEGTTYLYFVANGSGGHTFSSTLSGHQRAVEEYRRNARLSSD